MKKSLHPIALLLLFFLLGATSAAAQGVYIYKNGKKQVFHASEVDSLVFFENDDSADPSVTPAPLQLPTAQFGADINDLITAEQARGFTVSKTDDTHLTLTKTENGETFNWIYTFDASQSYKYAKCAIPAGGEEAFKASLRKAGYELRPEASRNAEVLVYVNETSKTVIFINKTGAQAEYIFGEYDEAPQSWTRIDLLKDAKTGTWMPYNGYHATLELLQLYAKRLNHKLDNEKSKPANGVYVYKTGDEQWPSIKYWFDVKTKSQLEEASIYVNPANIPTPADVTAYLKTLNYRYTGLTDNEGYTIYYNDPLPSACYVLMVDKTGGKGTFEPQMHYTYSDLTGNVPPAVVDLPMPIVEFGTKTMDEILVEYRKLPYYVSEEKNEMGVIINTNSPHFPKLLLMEDGGKYFAAFAITFDRLVIRAPYLSEYLTANGYEYKPEASALPTFVNAEKQVMAQFDVADIYQLGYYSISFQPNEIK